MVIYLPLYSNELDCSNGVWISQSMRIVRIGETKLRARRALRPADSMIESTSQRSLRGRGRGFWTNMLRAQKTDRNAVVAQGPVVFRPVRIDRIEYRWRVRAAQCHRDELSVRW